MTTKQRKALQAVVLEAADALHRNHERCGFFPFSCCALEEAFRLLVPEASRWDREEFSHAYWHLLMGGNCSIESLGERLGWDDMDDDAYELRLLMLALTHTLIGSGDFEAITGYNPDNP